MPRKYGIVLVFDDETNRKAMELSAKYLPQAEDPAFMLGLDANVPHLSLLHIMLEDAMVARCLASLKFALRGRPAIDGTFDAVRSHFRYLFWDGPKTGPLARLQLNIVSACAHLRAGPCKISWPLNSERRAMLRRYGYPNVGGCFNPHLTLRTVREEFAHTTFEEGEWRWRSDHVAFCHAADDGAMLSVIERLPLLAP